MSKVDSMMILLQAVLDLDACPQNNEPGSFIKLSSKLKEDITKVMDEHAQEEKAKEEKKERDVIALVSEFKALIRDATANGIVPDRMAKVWGSSVLDRIRKHFNLQEDEPGTGAGTPGALKKARDRHMMVSMNLVQGSLCVRRMSAAIGESGFHLVLGYSKDDCNNLLKAWSKGE